MADYYHDQVTQRSWQLLQQLQRTHRFILIGGWAVYLYTHALKSKDIDIAVSLDELSKMKSEFEIVKNERLKKYEAHQQEFDIDIYVEYYSDPGLPVEALQKSTNAIEGFVVPKIEYLLVLKLNAWQARRGSQKGEKDQCDIIALLKAGVDIATYRNILSQRHKEAQLEALSGLLTRLVKVPALDLNEHQYARLKKNWLEQLSKL